MTTLTPIFYDNLGNKLTCPHAYPDPKKTSLSTQIIIYNSGEECGNVPLSVEVNISN